MHLALPDLSHDTRTALAMLVIYATGAIWHVRTCWRILDESSRRQAETRVTWMQREREREKEAEARRKEQIATIQAIYADSASRLKAAAVFVVNNAVRDMQAGVQRTPEEYLRDLHVLLAQQEQLTKPKAN